MASTISDDHEESNSIVHKCSEIEYTTPFVQLPDVEDTGRTLFLNRKFNHFFKCLLTTCTLECVTGHLRPKNTSPNIVTSASGTASFWLLLSSILLIGYDF